MGAAAVKVKKVVAMLAQAGGVLMVLYAVAELAGELWAIGLAGAGLVAYGVLAEAGWL